MHPPPPAEPPDVSADDLITAAVPPVRTAEGWPPCPVDRLPRQRRNELCITIIVLGAVNFLAYTLTYAALGGDAHNGQRQRVVQSDGTQRWVYTLRGHFIHSLTGREREVSRGMWIYSYAHSISVPLTSGAMIISMLVLARPHILATMRGGWIAGPTFVAALGTLVVLVTLATTTLLVWHFVEALASA